MALKAAIIGKSGHAGKIISIIKELDGVDLKWVYYPKNDDQSTLPITSDFGKIFECDAVIIASPTHTHFGYLERLKDYSGYVLVEKPAVSTRAETKELMGYSDDFKKRLKVNYNFEYSKLRQLLYNLIQSPEFGTPTSFNVYTSHGLAFLDKYKDSWRSLTDHSFGVLELVGVHFMNLALSLFGDIKDLQVDFDWKVEKKENLSPDTATVKAIMQDKTVVNLYHSYAGPCLNKLIMIGTNGYVEYDGKEVKFYSPRETYDENGLFTQPPLKESRTWPEKMIWQESLKESLIDFFKTVKNKEEFSINILNKNLMAMEPIFKGMESI